LLERGGEKETAEKPGEKYEAKGILVPEYELVRPGPLERPERYRAWGILDRAGIAGEEETIAEVMGSAAELILDDIIEQERELPPFPGPPL
jgi:hypothetical protein